MSEIAIKALQEIKALESTPIGDTGWSVGPLALFQAAQRIARDALKAERSRIKCASSFDGAHHPPPPRRSLGMEESRHLTLEEQQMLDRAWKHGAKRRLIIGWTNPAPDASPPRLPSESVTIALSPSTRGE